MDLIGALERTLSGKVKPSIFSISKSNANKPNRCISRTVITQCSMRHLYLLKDVPQPTKEALILTAKSMERRRCNHHVLDDPLPTLECFASVIDPKKSQTNKNRYVVASQDEDVRRYCRGIKGVPLVFVKRSVMVMEPMAASSANAREGMEREKFRSGLKTRGIRPIGKRKRDEDDNGENAGEDHEARSMAERDEKTGKRRKVRGPKEPNPLSVKKSKKPLVADQKGRTKGEDHIAGSPEQPDVGEPDMNIRVSAVDDRDGAFDKARDHEAKRKRKRKHKSKKLEGLIASINSGNNSVE